MTFIIRFFRRQGLCWHAQRLVFGEILRFAANLSRNLFAPAGKTPAGTRAEILPDGIDCGSVRNARPVFRSERVSREHGRSVFERENPQWCMPSEKYGHVRLEIFRMREGH